MRNLLPFLVAAALSSLPAAYCETAGPGVLYSPRDPIAHSAPLEDGEPRVHGPTAIGCTPGRPFLYLISVTGKRPFAFKATDLPDGLALDSKSGIISGTIRQAGNYAFPVRVRNSLGEDSIYLSIKAASGKLAQTPPMGWNSWNVWAATVDAEKVKQAADALIKTGLAAHGYQYVNIDDGWEGERDKSGKMTANTKFPSMKSLADEVHAKGLKIGIYSSPGPKTCQKYEGSYQHEREDAQTFAEWGIDYLKYDLCSYKNLLPQNPTTEDYIKPYKVMGDVLKTIPRDIVYSLCQYGKGDVWKWGASIGGNLWRTTGDIGDRWATISGIGFEQNELAPYAAPGHWNDPDMLVVGALGQGWGTQVHKSELTPDEQITHISLWCMLSAPLLIGCDLTHLDQWTLDLLTNDEVLALDQDPLGKQASRKTKLGDVEIWTKPLVDGTLAVGLFNRADQRSLVKLKWQDLGLNAPQMVRDLWRHNDLGRYADTFYAEVPRHGTILIKLTPLPKTASLDSGKLLAPTGIPIPNF